MKSFLSAKTPPWKKKLSDKERPTHEFSLWWWSFASFIFQPLISQDLTWKFLDCSITVCMMQLCQQQRLVSCDSDIENCFRSSLLSLKWEFGKVFSKYFQGNLVNRASWNIVSLFWKTSKSLYISENRKNFEFAKAFRLFEIESKLKKRRRISWFSWIFAYFWSWST